MDRWGPPRIEIEAVPFTWNDGPAVRCKTTSGTGALIACNPQLAVAVTLTVLVEESNFVNHMSTGSVTVTLIYGLATAGKPPGMPATPGTLVGKLTLTCDPAYPLSDAY